MPALYSMLAEQIKAGRPVVMCTALTPPRLGAKMLVAADSDASAKMLVAADSDASPTGSIDPEIDARIAGDALRLLAERRSATLTYQASGRPLDVFIETFPSPMRLVIVGAVHVAIPLHALAHMLGYHVTVIDARGVLATSERFPQADAVLAEWPDEAMSRLALNESTSVVVLAHDPKFDHPALAAALRSGAHYIGAIGSRGTIRQREEALLEMGFTPQQLARIYAPIGLDIGSQSPAEIALAIMAEVVAVRRDRPGGHLRRE